MNTKPRYDLLVVGAGPAGLATALSAARHGARVLVVERHPGTSVHPRASGITTRTMEILRGWEVADAVLAASSTTTARVGIGRTLADPDLTERPSGFPDLRQALAVSPAHPVSCPQDRLEPLLLEQVRRFGGEVRFRTALDRLAVDEDGVRATLHGVGVGVGVGVKTQARQRVVARFVVGADGIRSRVRAALGIGVEHLGTVADYVQLIFRADLSPVLGARTLPLYALSHPDAAGLVIDFGAGRWGYARQWHPEDGERLEDFTADRWTRLLVTVTGLPDLRPDLHDWKAFTLAAELATTYRAGRGFLVGDAAHRMTPFGSLGLNTAIHDGHNLGWKLAWVARGLAGSGLLDSYPAEREPVGRRNAVRSLNPGEADVADHLALDLGVRYASSVIDVRDSGTGAAPGERAPHVWVFDRGRRLSTLDLFGPGLTVISGRQGQRWCRAARALARTGLPVDAVLAGHDVRERHAGLTDAYRLGETGAVLVRPDGYVAWRCEAAVADHLAPPGHVAVLRDAVDTALGRTASTSSTTTTSLPTQPAQAS